MFALPCSGGSVYRHLREVNDEIVPGTSGGDVDHGCQIRRPGEQGPEAGIGYGLPGRGVRAADGVIRHIGLEESGRVNIIHI